MMGCSQKTVMNHPKYLGLALELEAWVPYQPSEFNKKSQLDAAFQYLTPYWVLRSYNDRSLLNSLEKQYYPLR